jgi:hypothetical protein
MRIDYGGDDPTEVDEDLAEELPDAAEDAREAAESESIPYAGWVRARVLRLGRGTPLGPSAVLPPPATTIAFEGEQEEARQRAAEQSDQDS